MSSDEKQTKQTKQSKKNQLINELIERGAVHEIKEDRFGETKSGWWMDQTFLAPFHCPDLALEVLNG